jgi:lipopolysaccharide export system protein LptA
MEWNSKQEIATAQDQVVVYYKDLTATADAMSFDQAKNILKLMQSGTNAKNPPQILQAGNIISGKLITLLVKERVYEVEGSAKAIFLPETRPAKAQE